MTWKKLISPLYHFLFALASAVVGAIVASWPLILVFVLTQKTYETVNLTVGQVMHNYNQLMGYLLWPFTTKLHMSNLATSANAAEHFAEVKHLLLFAVLVFIVCIIVHFAWAKGKNKQYLKLSKTASLIFLLLPIIVLPFAMSNFDSFFVTFHHIFFHNSNWLFDPATDPIINILTEGFFSACFAVAGIIYELYFAEKLLRR